MANIVTTTQWGTVTVSNDVALTNTSNIFINTFNIPYPNTPNLSPSSPTGAFIQELTNMQINVSSTVAYVTSNVYGLDSTNGIFLDGIGNLFGILRGAASYTRVVCEISGVVGTVIPSLSLVSDGVHNFISDTPYTIVSGLNAMVFTCTTIGAIIVSQNTVTTIVTPIAGWSAVNNSNDGITGKNIQNDTSYRYALKYGQAINSRSMTDSLYATFLNFMTQTGATSFTDNTGSYPFIQGFYTFVNQTSAPVTISAGTTPVPVGGVYITLYAPQFLDASLPSYADNQQYIAGLILNQIGANQTLNIASGGGTRNFIVDYNNLNYTAIDPVRVYFDSPDPTLIKLEFTVKLYNASSLASVLQENAENAILNQFYNGYQGYEPAQMNVPINTSDYYIAIINAVGGSASITAQNVQLASGGIPATSLTLTLDKVAVLTKPNINVTIIL